MRISLSFFIVYTLIICFIYDFRLEYKKNEIFLWIFPLFLVLLHDFALDKNTFYNGLLFCRKTLIKITFNKITIEIAKFISETIKDFCKYIWHWFISVVPGIIIAGIGLYLSSVFNQDWIWNIALIATALTCAILFTHNTRND